MSFFVLSLILFPKFYTFGFPIPRVANVDAGGGAGVGVACCLYR
jgi:hypothetical protein